MLQKWLAAGAALALAAAALSEAHAQRFRDGIDPRARDMQAAPAPDSTPAPDYRAGARRFAVEIEDGSWTDAARAREIPWRLYRPAGVESAPVLVFSHGAGGSREGGAWLGEYLAGFGYASFHIEHAGTDRDAVREAVRAAPRRERRDAAREAFAQIGAAVNDPALAEDRFRDLAFAAEQIAHMGAAAGLDPSRLGVYGHSFGAISTLVAAGQAVEGYGRSLAVPAFDAALALSPSPPRPGYGTAEAAYQDMTAPVFHITGTRDESPGGDVSARERLIPFETIRDVDQYALVLDGAAHMTFGGRAPRSDDDFERHVRAVRIAALAFFDAHLLGDPRAHSFLAEGGAFERSLGEADEYRVKSAER